MKNNCPIKSHYERVIVALKEELKTKDNLQQLLKVRVADLEYINKLLRAKAEGFHSWPINDEIIFSNMDSEQLSQLSKLVPLN